jgi:hypothetical protein
MKKNYYFAVALFLPLLFCQHLNSPDPTPDADVPGYFSLTQLQGLQKTVAITADTNTINLGDLHSTTNYYFLLTNCGGHVITHINLSVSDSSFAIFPTSIDSLTVGFGTQALVPIIKLTAIHGTGAQGLGSAPLMSPGIHQVQINVTGTTRHNYTDTNTSLIATVNINALVMDLDIHTSLTTIDLTDKSIVVSGSIQFDGFIFGNITGYSDSTDSVATIINRGNVILKIKTAESQCISCGYSDSSSCLINVSDSATFIVRSGTQLTFCLDGNNTVCDPRKLQLLSNGKAYFFIENPN